MTGMSGHPGTITFIDGNTDEVLAVRAAEDVPERDRFVGQTPVLRVLWFVDGDRRLVHEYGPGRELLRTRVEVRST